MALTIEPRSHDASLPWWKELGSYPEQMFEGMTDTPVASASLGQVYKAQLYGKPVAVKVQRPDLLEIAGLDFYLARTIAAVIMSLSRELDHLSRARLGVRSDLVAAVDEYGSRLFEELDYRIEARNMVRFRELYGTTPGVLVPGVLLAFSGRRVITTEWVDGDKLVNAKAQVDPSDMPILRTGIDFTLTQLLEKGFLHADPHGGNLLKTFDGKLAYLDFGLVSTIPPTVMDALVCATMYIMNRDYVRLARNFPSLALMSDGNLLDDFGPFAAALEDALDPVVTDFRFQLGLDRESLRSSSSSSERVAFAQLIDKVFSLARSFEFRVPPYFISNVRALGELEGLALAADPGFSLISAVYPYVCRRLLSKPGPVLREALQELVVTQDGSVRWTVLEGMIRDASILDGRYGPSAENRRSPLDLALDFLVSTEGSFIRGALVSDLRRSATRFFRRRLPSRLGFKSERSSPIMSGICGDDLRGGEKHASEAQGVRRSSAFVSLDSGDCHSAAGHETLASLRTSRRALMRQLAQGVLRRPALVLRGCAATVTSCIRAAYRTVAGVQLRGRSRRRRWLRLQP